MTYIFLKRPDLWCTFLSENKWANPSLQRISLGIVPGICFFFIVEYHSKERVAWHLPQSHLGSYLTLVSFWFLLLQPITPETLSSSPKQNWPPLPLQFWNAGLTSLLGGGTAFWTDVYISKYIILMYMVNYSKTPDTWKYSQQLLSTQLQSNNLDPE